MDLETTNKNNLKINTEKTNNQIQNTQSFSIDRFEGIFAVCENRETGEFINIPISELPENCAKGSILKFENGKYILDSETTNKEQDEIKQLVNNLFRKKDC